MAGEAPTLLYANLDIARMQHLYDMQGTWRLLEGTLDSQRAEKGAQTLEPAQQTQVRLSEATDTQRPATTHTLIQMKQLVKSMAADLAGIELGGKDTWVSGEKHWDCLSHMAWATDHTKNHPAGNYEHRPGLGSERLYLSDVH